MTMTARLRHDHDTPVHTRRRSKASRLRALGLAAALATTTLASTSFAEPGDDDTSTSGPEHDLLRAAGSDERARAEAVELFRAANEAYERGDFAGAARAFEDSMRLVPRAAAALNAARSWDGAGDRARAGDAYATALALGDMQPDDTRSARERLQAIEEALGVVRVVAPSGARATVGHVEGRVVSDGELVVHLEAGDYVLSVTRGRARGARNVHVTAGGRVEAKVDLVEAEAEPQAPAEGPPVKQATSAPTRTWGFVALGGAGVFSVAAIALGASAVSARDDFLVTRTDRDAHDRAVTMRTLTNVAWTGAAVSAVAATVLLLISISSSDGAATRAASRSALLTF